MYRNGYAYFFCVIHTHIHEYQRYIYVRTYNSLHCSVRWGLEWLVLVPQSPLFDDVAFAMSDFKEGRFKHCHRP